MARLKQLPQSTWYVDPAMVSGIQQIAGTGKCRLLVDGHEVVLEASMDRKTGERDTRRLFNELMDFAEGHPK